MSAFGDLRGGRVRARLVLLVTVLGLVAGLHAIAPERAHALIAVCDEDAISCIDDGAGGGGGGEGDGGGQGSVGEAGDPGGQSSAGDTGGEGDAGDEGQVDDAADAGDPAASDPAESDPAAGDPAAGDPAAGDPGDDPTAGDPDGPAAHGEQGDQNEGGDPEEADDPDDRDDPGAIDIGPIPNADPWRVVPSPQDPNAPDPCSVKRDTWLLAPPGSDRDAAQWDLLTCMQSNHQTPTNTIARVEEPGKAAPTTTVAQQATQAVKQLHAANLAARTAMEAALKAQRARARRAAVRQRPARHRRHTKRRG